MSLPQNTIKVNDFLHFKKKDKEFLDESVELITQWSEYYADKFLQSKVALDNLSKNQRREVSLVISSFCSFCYAYYLQKPGQWTEEAVEHVCADIMPRKCMASETFFSAIVPVLTQFLTWLSDEKILSDMSVIKNAIVSVKSEIADNANNSDNWDMAKSLLMGASAMGYDTENPRAIEAALSNENIDELFAASDYTDNSDLLPPKKTRELQSIEDIADDLCFLTRGFPKPAVQAAIKRQKEITPILMSFLQDVIDDQDIPEDDYTGHIYALFLLAQFREKDAFPLVIQLISLPDETPEKLLGDIITEHLHNIIASVYTDNLAAIKQVIENPKLNTWSRNAALKSLLTLVKEGVLQREDVITYFCVLFKHPAFINDEMAMTHLVSASSDLYPEELYKEIKMAFEQGKVDADIIDMEWIDFVMEKGRTNILEDNLFNYYGYIDDTIQELSSWICFQDSVMAAQDDLLSSDKLELDHFESSLPYIEPSLKVGRNAKCPCGSGKKYKKCCLGKKTFNHKDNN